jgi:hypothetical protein
MLRHAFAVLAVVIVVLNLFSCSSSDQALRAVLVPDGLYDSEFPTQPVSKYLEQITESVLRLNSIAYYQTFSFGDKERFRIGDVSPAVLSAHEFGSVFSSTSTSGTATVISASNRQMAMLTCAHIVSFPETVYAYQFGLDKRQTEYVSTVSVLKRVLLYVASLPEGGTVSPVVVDRDADLAVVAKKFDEPQPFLPPVIRYPVGKAADLDWGSFLYLFGSPAGNKVSTKGIVSSPRKDKRESFLVDAVIGRGFSGGICMALRDGVPHFEIVGMIKTVPARTSFVLTPGKDRLPEELELEMPYSGSVYVERRTEIDYGITQAVSAETIRAFIEEHRTALSDEGYGVERILRNAGGS